MEKLFWRFLFILLATVSLPSFGQRIHSGIPNAYYPTLDYLVMDYNPSGEERKLYKGFGFTNRGNLSLLQLAFRNRKFLITDVFDFSLLT